MQHPNTGETSSVKLAKMCSLMTEYSNIEYFPVQNNIIMLTIICGSVLHSVATYILQAISIAIRIKQPTRCNINRKIYRLVVQTLLSMFRALQCPSSGARQTAVAASGFRMNVEVEVFSAVVGLLVTN